MRVARASAKPRRRHVGEDRYENEIEAAGAFTPSGNTRSADFAERSTETVLVLLGLARC
ncbi:hypothetical protein [Polyangium mundeleinium]|uniref:Uncharacterized protein n=1 Tax=Polyangium mundeleinium TaxID=2995306 RepID=A0ABT5EWZ3_9BACT|nr:hypothetical protein [Polyangium mundeleinium]MDC0746333.1 hypothetical protein [Polyangium mundeleinium]